MTLSVRLQHAFPAFALDIAFEARDGITAVFGASGSGKTTTIKAIAGLLHPRGGRIDLDGETLFDSDARIDVPPQKRRIGVVFQEPRLFPHLNVAQNLRYGWRRSPSRLRKTEFDGIVSLLALEPLLRRGPSKLSGGERQRVAIGRALLASPRLLLLDEPLSGLDRALREEVLPYLERLRDDARIPILYVSHSLDEVARLAGDVVVLADGKVAAQGSVFDVFARPELAALVGDQSGAVLTATVQSHLAADALTELDFEGNRLLVPRLEAAPGARVRVRILARDVTIALHKPERISANNILAVTVAEIGAGAGANADIRLACGNAHLLARITRHSCTRLGLTADQAAFAIVKSVTIDRRAAGV